MLAPPRQSDSAAGTRVGSVAEKFTEAAGPSILVARGRASSCSTFQQVREIAKAGNAEAKQLLCSLRRRGLKEGMKGRTLARAKAMYNKIPEGVKNFPVEAQKKWLDSKHASHIRCHAKFNGTQAESCSPANLIFEDSGPNIDRGARDMTGLEKKRNQWSNFKADVSARAPKVRRAVGKSAFRGAVGGACFGAAKALAAAREEKLWEGCVGEGVGGRVFKEVFSGALQGCAWSGGCAAVASVVPLPAAALAAMPALGVAAAAVTLVHIAETVDRACASCTETGFTPVGETVSEFTPQDIKLSQDVLQHMHDPHVQDMVRGALDVCGRTEGRQKCENTKSLKGWSGGVYRQLTQEATGGRVHEKMLQDASVSRSDGGIVNVHLSTTEHLHTVLDIRKETDQQISLFGLWKGTPTETIFEGGEKSSRVCEKQIDRQTTVRMKEDGSALKMRELPPAKQNGVTVSGTEVVTHELTSKSEIYDFQADMHDTHETIKDVGVSNRVEKHDPQTAISGGLKVTTDKTSFISELFEDVLLDAKGSVNQAKNKPGDCRTVKAAVIQTVVSDVKERDDGLPLLADYVRDSGHDSFLKQEQQRGDQLSTTFVHEHLEHVGRTTLLRAEIVINTETTEKPSPTSAAYVIKTETTNVSRKLDIDKNVTHKDSMDQPDGSRVISMGTCEVYSAFDETAGGDTQPHKTEVKRIETNSRLHVSQEGSEFERRDLGSRRECGVQITAEEHMTHKKEVIQKTTFGNGGGTSEHARVEHSGMRETKHVHDPVIEARSGYRKENNKTVIMKEHFNDIVKDELSINGGAPEQTSGGPQRNVHRTEAHEIESSSESKLTGPLGLHSDRSSETINKVTIKKGGDETSSSNTTVTKEEVRGGFFIDDVEVKTLKQGEEVVTSSTRKLSAAGSRMAAAATSGFVTCVLDTVHGKCAKSRAQQKLLDIEKERERLEKERPIPTSTADCPGIGERLVELDAEKSAVQGQLIAAEQRIGSFSSKVVSTVGSTLEAGAAGQAALLLKSGTATPKASGVLFGIVAAGLVIKEAASELSKDKSERRALKEVAVDAACGLFGSAAQLGGAAASWGSGRLAAVSVVADVARAGAEFHRGQIGREELCSRAASSTVLGATGLGVGAAVEFGLGCLGAASATTLAGSVALAVIPAVVTTTAMYYAAGPLSSRCRWAVQTLGSWWRRRNERAQARVEYVKLCQELGIDPDGPARRVRCVYRQLALRCHPDKGGDPGVFKELVEKIERIERLRVELDLPATLPPDFRRWCAEKWATLRRFRQDYNDK